MRFSVETHALRTGSRNRYYTANAQLVSRLIKIQTEGDDDDSRAQS